MVNGAFLLPVVALFSLAVWPEPGRFSTLWAQGLPVYLLHTLVLVLGTLVLSLLMGLSAAWVMAVYHFPGKRGVAWALCLPLVMPAFLIANFYLDMLGQSGTVRALMGDIGWFSAETAGARSLAGACAVMALAFYPYVYLPVRHALETQPAHWLQAAQSLKLSSRQVFWRLSFPLIRPAMAASAVLVVVETLNDYATATLFSLSTLTTVMIDAGVLQGDAHAVARWTVTLLPLLALLVWLGLRARQRQSQYAQQDDVSVITPRALSRGKALGVTLACWLLALLALGLPLGRLLYWALAHITAGWNAALLWAAALHSVAIASLSALLLCLLAVPFLFFIRHAGLTAGRVSFALSLLSYVLPGAALAIGIAVPLITLDNGIHSLGNVLGISLSAPLFSYAGLMMVAVYCLKFSRFMLEPLSVRMVQIPQVLDQASIAFGHTLGQRGWRVYFPLLKFPMAMGAIIVFFEGMKELNAAFMFRTLGLETLPTYVFRMVSDNQLEWGALPALWLVAIGCVPMLWFQRVWKGNNG